MLPNGSVLCFLGSAQNSKLGAAFMDRFYLDLRFFFYRCFGFRGFGSLGILDFICNQRRSFGQGLLAVVWFLRFFGEVRNLVEQFFFRAVPRSPLLRFLY